MISHEHELANRWLCRTTPGPETMGGRRSRRLAIRDMRAELTVAGDAFFSAARKLNAVGGAAALQTCRRCLCREVVVRGALAAMEDFELGEESYHSK